MKKQLVLVPLCGLALVASIARAEFPLGPTHLLAECALARPGQDAYDVTITTMDGLPGTFIAVYDTTLMGSRLDIANYRVIRKNAGAYVDENTGGSIVRLDIDAVGSPEPSGDLRGTLRLGEGAGNLVLTNMACRSYAALHQILEPELP